MRSVVDMSVTNLGAVLQQRVDRTPGPPAGNARRVV